MKVTIRRGRKIGRPNYSSEDIGIELTDIECDDELYYDRPAEFKAFIERNYTFADELLDAEATRIDASRGPDGPAPEHGRSGSPTPAGRSRRPGRERSRGTAPQRLGRGYAKERHEWDHRGDRPPDRDDRDRTAADRGRERGRPGGGGRGGSQGPPRNGKALFAWARGIEEEGRCRGLVKWLNAYGKRLRAAEPVRRWTADEVRRPTRGARRWIRERSNDAGRTARGPCVGPSSLGPVRPDVVDRGPHTGVARDRDACRREDAVERRPPRFSLSPCSVSGSAWRPRARRRGDRPPELGSPGSADQGGRAGVFRLAGGDVSRDPCF